MIGARSNGMDCERIRVDIDDKNRTFDDRWIISVGKSELKAHVYIVKLKLNNMEVARQVASIAAERQRP